jgi:hypothetical protein
MGGADVIRQALRAGYVEELSISIAPVVLGGGKRLFDDFDATVRLEHLGMRQSPFATHMAVLHLLVRGVLRPPRVRALDRQGQLVESDLHPPGHRFLDGQFVMATPQVLDEAMPGDHDLGAAILLAPTHRTQPRLETAVVGLDVAVAILIGAVPRRREHLVQRDRVGRRLVGDDLHGRDLGGADGPLEEAAGCLGVALWRRTRR